MRIQFPSLRARFLGQVAVAALLSGLATGCSADANRAGLLHFTGATPNQRAIIENQMGASQASYSRPSYDSSSYGEPTYGSSNQPGQGYGYTGSVGKAAVKPVSKVQPLPPVTNRTVPTVSSDAQIRSERTASAPSKSFALPKIFQRREGEPAPAPAASAPAVERVASSGPSGWTGTGGTIVTLREGDTLYSLSRRYGVPTEALMRVNGISDPAQVTPGQNITIPTYVYSANAPISAPDAGMSGRIAKMETEAVPLPAARPGAGRAQVAGLPDMTPTGSIGRPVSNSTSGGSVHIVNPGESLGGIAARYGMSSRDLMAVNRIDDPNHIRVGQRLVIPANAGGPRVASADTGRSDVDMGYTGSIPGAAAPAVPRPQPRPDGSVSYRPVPPITADTRQMTTASIPTPAVRPSDRPAAQPAAYTPPRPAEAVDPQTTATVPAGDSQRSANGTTFRWPVRGRIISEFGARPDGQRNDGINLAVPEGTSVKSAEDGVVVYSGSELKGYGNLVLIKHADGWVTAYAHNSELMVQRGDRVGRGQIIAKAGKSGGVTTPQLHFELRRGSKPVDPMQFLSSS